MLALAGGDRGPVRGQPAAVHARLQAARLAMDRARRRLHHELKTEQRERKQGEREAEKELDHARRGGPAPTPGADKAAYLEEKLAERERAEREAE